MRAKNLLVVIALCSCSKSSEPRTPAPSSPRPATGQTTLGPFPVDVKTNARHAYIATIKAAEGVDAVITTSSVLTGPDRFERTLPACIELAAGTDSLTVSSSAEHLAAWVVLEGDNDFNSDACANASLPPSIQR